MKQNRSKYKPGTRAARFLEIRDAVLSHSGRMINLYPGIKELAVGPFLIHFATPGAMGPGKGFSINIWPDGAAAFDHIIYGDKVANVDWNRWDDVDLISYRSGKWESELMNLLAAPNVIGFPPPS